MANEGYLRGLIPPAAEAESDLSYNNMSALMPHINLPEGLPGIRGPMAFRSGNGDAAQRYWRRCLLRGPNTLTPGERELIATYFFPNDCFFCQNIHGAIAAYHLGDNESW